MKKYFDYFAGAGEDPNKYHVVQQGRITTYERKSGFFKKFEEIGSKSITAETQITDIGPSACKVDGKDYYVQDTESFVSAIRAEM